MPEHWMDWGVSQEGIIVLMGLHCIIGLTAALLARQQGRPFLPWIFWGLLGGTIALIAAIVRPVNGGVKEPKA